MKRKLRTHLLKTIICETTLEAAAGVHHHPHTAGLAPDSHHGALPAEFTPHTEPGTLQGSRHRAHTAIHTARLRRQGSPWGAQCLGRCRARATTHTAGLAAWGCLMWGHGAKLGHPRRKPPPQPGRSCPAPCRLCNRPCSEHPYRQESLEGEKSVHAHSESERWS